LRAAGYGKRRRLEVLHGDPGFIAATRPDRDGHHLKLMPKSLCRGRTQSTRFELEGGKEMVLPAGRDVGAWQGDRLFDLADLSA
jgi:hypothetical protein